MPLHAPMSLARPINKNACLMITRRIHVRQFRLRPSREVTAIIKYVVAVVAKRTGIRLHCVIVMSNHWHVVFTDPDGRVAEFTRDCHALIARALNARYGDFESIWSHEQTSHVTCEEPQDIVRKIAYAMANPVEARLVKYGKNWPGLRKCWPAKPCVVRRPSKFFRSKKAGGTWPDSATLEMSRPPGFDELSDEELAKMLADAIHEREETFRAEAAKNGEAFIGRREVLAQSRYQYPNTPEPRFEMSPRVACKDKWRRIERLQRNRAWREAYTEALRKWMDGDREVVFPYGTYKMRILHGCKCAPAPV